MVITSRGKQRTHKRVKSQLLGSLWQPSRGQNEMSAQKEKPVVGANRLQSI